MKSLKECVAESLNEAKNDLLGLPFNVEDIIHIHCGNNKLELDSQNDIGDNLAANDNNLFVHNDDKMEFVDVYIKVWEIYTTHEKLVMCTLCGKTNNNDKVYLVEPNIELNKIMNYLDNIEIVEPSKARKLDMDFDNLFKLWKDFRDGKIDDNTAHKKFIQIFKRFDF